MWRSLALSKPTKNSHRFKPLDTLPADYTTIFRDSFFLPQKPVIFPRGHFRSIPAASRWFAANDGVPGSPARLNYAYLEEYSACHVPLELTKQVVASKEPGNAPAGQNRNHFHRFYAPLSLFLDWTRSMQPSESINSDENSNTGSIRLYLAQCQLLDLPLSLRNDLPTPSIVTTVGKGDIYDTNIWLGLAPTYTPLHRDPNPNLFVQLAGSKRVRLLPPERGLRTFAKVRDTLGKDGGRHNAAYRGEEMMQGPEMELLDQEVWGDNPTGEEAGSSGLSREEHKRMEGLEENEKEEDGYDVILNAGDGLFIPLGWWHSIKGVGEGITGSVNWWFR
ncbi:hypothetical protein VTO42DRAFT_6275 [Malbranchea cinnamomea]